MTAKHSTLPALRATGAVDIINDPSALLKNTATFSPDSYPYLRNIGAHLSRLLELDDTQAGMRVGLALSNHMNTEARQKFISGAVGPERVELCNASLEHVRSKLTTQQWTGLEKEIALAITSNVD